MDSLTYIAIASIVVAGLTTGFGTMGPALAEGRAVATALTALAQQPDASATITRTLFVGLAMIESTAIYCFVVSMILIFANPFWNAAIAQAAKAAGKYGMLIDWFTVGAQVLNFIVLGWLMKHFLYKPVLDAIDAREKRIASQLADADKKKAAALGERAELKQKNEAFDQQRAALLDKATAEANGERQKLLDAARQAADALTASHQQKMASDAKELGQALRQRTQDEVFAVARQALADLATASLEASACELFIARLQMLEGPPLDYMAAALKASRDGALVRTAFELPVAQRTALHKAVNDVFAMKVTLRYEVAPALVSGIELSAHGQKFAWSIDGYLASLERGVAELLKAPAKPDKKPEAPATPAAPVEPKAPEAANAPAPKSTPEPPAEPAPRPA